MHELYAMRQEYIHDALEIENLDSDPVKQFSQWFEDAKEADVIEPNAFNLATTDLEGFPSQRVVLLKYFDEKGFVFFTNYTSNKAAHIKKSPKVSAHFAWLKMHRQVAIQGEIKKISRADSLKYFLSRPKGSQIGAWVSHQSRVISSRSLLEEKFQQIKDRFSKGEIPLPDFWGGYKVYPKSFEFWQGGQNRLHDRFVYTKNDENNWSIKRLEP